ncbi:hypothetical protein Tamer19_53510 [Cupriavidus sp. TA19]|nr:hypothetical protein Tamer19_53510 [Cupriavidus sp. TA19]
MVLLRSNDRDPAQRGERSMQNGQSRREITVIVGKEDMHGAIVPERGPRKRPARRAGVAFRCVPRPGMQGANNRPSAFGMEQNDRAICTLHLPCPPA